MSKYLSSMALASLALATIATHAANTVPLPDSEQFTPIPQMEIGKVKRVSRNQLPQELKDYTAQEIATSKRGFEDVPEEYFVYLSNYTNRVRLDGDVLPNTKVSLADIGKTALAKYHYEGITPEGPTITGPWTSITRIFKRPDGAVVRLTEWDFVADGGAIVIVDEVMNANVAGKQAFFSVKRSPSGKSITSVEWATDKKQYTVSVENYSAANGVASTNERGWLLKLASSIPK